MIQVFHGLSDRRFIHESALLDPPYYGQYNYLNLIDVRRIRLFADGVLQRMRAAGAIEYIYIHVYRVYEESSTR